MPFLSTADAVIAGILRWLRNTTSKTATSYLVSRQWAVGILCVGRGQVVSS